MMHKEKGDILIKKNKISAFYKTTLEKKLKTLEIRRLIICGILTNLCVRSLVEGAYDREFDIDVVKDCCVSYERETQEFTFNDLKSTRPEIKFCELRDFTREEYQTLNF